MAKRNTTAFDGERAEGVMLDDPEFLRGIVEQTLQQILETEMSAHVGAGRYERGEGQTGHRNGYKPRELRTRVGPAAPPTVVHALRPITPSTSTSRYHHHCASPCNSWIGGAGPFGHDAPVVNVLRRLETDGAILRLEMPESVSASSGWPATGL